MGSSTTMIRFNLAQALGSDIADKRLDILRRIGDAGSISEAARGAGVSYKAAWQAVETLGNLAGTALVDKAVGGSGGGGARLTEAGRQVLEGAALLARARSEVLARVHGKAPAGAAAPGPLAGMGLRTSMRNHLPCRIHAVRRSGAAVRVLLDLGAGATLVSRITRESVQLLGLAPGLQVLALCKATAVPIAAGFAAREGTTVLHGTVTRMGSAARGGEVSMQLDAGPHLVGFAAAGNGLRRGVRCAAQVEESAVVVGLLG